MAKEEVKKEEVEQKTEELKEAVKEELKDVDIEKKGGFRRFLAFCWKWAKRLALPIGIVIGIVLDMIFRKGGDDDLDDEIQAEDEAPAE